MTTQGPLPGPAIYEFTIAGALGPVLRAALQPHDACNSQKCTIMRVERNASRDIVDLVAVLNAKGLKVEEVSKVIDARPEA